MTTPLKISPDDLRSLAGKLRTEADDIKKLTYDDAFAPLIAGLAGSDTAGAFSEAPSEIHAALAIVSQRIDSLAGINSQAADAIEHTEDEYVTVFNRLRQKVKDK